MRSFFNQTVTKKKNDRGAISREEKDTTPEFLFGVPTFWRLISWGDLG